MAQHIALALSGGVDSTVTGLLLKQQGFKVTAIFMQNWSSKHDAYCSSEQDLIDARMVADQLAIELKVVDFSKDYWDKVFNKCVDEFAKGYTPNPDVLCNQEIKFKCLLDFAMQIGADKLATGHYAQIKFVDGTYKLIQGIDTNKDQSYFLYRLNQQQLSKSMFPLGNMHKPEVRKIATAAGLINHNKKDSTGICFIGERQFKTFMQQYLLGKPGNIVTEDGEIIGKHDGVVFYTIGQRKGLNIGGVKNRPDEPWFVAEKNLENNILTVVQGENNPKLFKQELRARDLNWIVGTAPDFHLQAFAKTRYRGPHQECMVEQAGDEIIVKFKEPQRAITLGQSVVIYLDNECLGGGIIC